MRLPESTELSSHGPCSLKTAVGPYNVQRTCMLVKDRAQEPCTPCGSLCKSWTLLHSQLQGACTRDTERLYM